MVVGVGGGIEAGRAVHKKCSGTIIKDFRVMKSFLYSPGIPQGSFLP